MAHIKSRKHATPSRFGGPAVATAVALSLPAALHAQQAPAAGATLPEVKVRAGSEAEREFKADTVSSPKFTAPLVDTPQTISVIRKEVIQQQGAVSLSEALQNTPGITLLAGENGNTATGDAIFMRGFDTQGSIYVDGIRDIGTISRDMFNIEQVEVVKGPTGSDNGRSTAAGYINLSTKVPGLEDFTAGRFGLTTGGRARLTADVNRKFGGDLGGAVRLNLMKTEGGIDKRDEVRKDVWAIAPSIALGLGTPTRTYLAYLHTEQRDRPDGGVPTVGLDGFFNATLGVEGSAATSKVDRENYYGSKSDYDNIVADMLTVRFEHDFRPGLTVRNTTRYGRTEQRLLLTGVNALGNLEAGGAITDPSTWTVARTRQRKLQDNEIITNQTNLRVEFATGPVQHTLSTGIEFIHEKQNLPTYALPAGVTQVPANLYDPSTSDPFVTPVANGVYNKGSTTTAAIYAFDTLKFSERFLLNAGLRYERFRTEYDAAALSTAATDPGLPVGTLVPRSGRLSDDLFSWKLGFVFKPAPNGSVYIAAANSFLPPGGSNFQLISTSVNANNPNLDPQESSNIEIGTKWDVLGGKLALTAAAFRSENKNEIITDTATNETLQIGKRSVKGIELGAVGEIMPGWQLSAGYAHMDPKINRGSTGGTGPTDGGVIQWTPKNTFTLWSSYRLPVGLTLGGGVRYVDTVRRSSSTLATEANTNMLKVPDYWVFDAMAAYEVTKNVTVQLNLYNLADEEYIARLNNSGARYFAGRPRSAELSASVAF